MRVQWKQALFCLIFAWMLCCSGCSKGEKGEGDITPTLSEEQTKPQDMVIMTVGNQKLTYAELMLYLRSRKQEVEALYGEDIWDYQLDAEKTTYETMLKEQMLEDLIYVKLVCAQAPILGITLTEDELLDIDEYTTSFLAEFTEQDMQYYGFDKETVKRIYKDNLLANKIYESLTLNVDTEVSDEEARQMQFWYILIAKYGYDEEGNRFEYTEEQLEEAAKRAEDTYEKAKEAEDFYALAKEASDDNDIEIIVGHGEMAEELEKAAFSLKQGELSPVVENETGYFMFYCVSDLEEEATNAKKEEIIKQRQEKVFDESYKTWEEETKVTIDEELWGRITLKGKDISLREEQE